MEFNYGHEPVSYMKYGGQAPVNDTQDLGLSSSEYNQQDIEGPISKTGGVSGGPAITTGDLGQSVTEGSRFGNFMQTLTAAIRQGSSKVELQFGSANEPNTGAESYGKESRQALRELAKANEVELTSVHVPSSLGNLSGFDARQGFTDESRKHALEEIRRAVEFAAEVAGGGGVTTHTGEFARPISEQDWAARRDKKGNIVRDSAGNKQYDFLGYAEEPGRAITYLVDDRNGKIISDVRKSMVIREPDYLRAEKDYEGFDIHGKKVKVSKGDFVTEDGKYIDRADVDGLFKRVPKFDGDSTRFVTRKLTWNEIEGIKDDWNKKHPEKSLTTEEMAHRIQIENQIMNYRGHSLYHGKYYQGEKEQYEKLKEALTFYEDIEKRLPKEEVWKIMKQDHRMHSQAGQMFVGSQYRLPTEIIKDQLFQHEKQMQYTHEASASADAQADTLKDTLEHMQTIDKYGKSRSFTTLAEAGIYAMEKTKDHKLQRDVFLTPENVFPEMGYGSHPEELIELIKKSRERMVEMLTKKEIEDPHRRLTLVDRNGEKREEFLKIPNPYYRDNMSVEEAKKYAERHIKANLDTQHMGMWGKNFQPHFLEEKKRMETPEETKQRFNVWYKDQVKKLADSGVLGEIHIVDGFQSGGHSHLPAGQGELPVVDAVQYLRSKGFKGIMISEGHGEETMSPGRIVKKTWEAFGSDLFSGYFGGGAGGGGFGAPVRFQDVHNSYFQKQQGPYFVFGGYSPSNDWTLWSEVPME